MKRKMIVSFLLLILLTGAITGCGRKTASESTAPSSPMMNKGTSRVGLDVAFSESAPTAGSASNYVYNDGAKMAESEERVGGIVATGYQPSTASLDILAQRKIIRNASLSMEVDDFYLSYGHLQAMLGGIGFVQESNISRDYYYRERERKTRVIGSITLRVDARHFDRILNDIKGLGEIIDDRIYSTDVTDQFFDTEGRLRILKTEYDFLEEYMRSLKDPDAIFKTRMRMTELQTDIERLTGTLNKWSDLVELSTIYIQMNEKIPERDVSEPTYWDRLKETLQNSLTGIVDAIGDLLIFIIEILPTLVILFLFGFFGYRILKKRLIKKKENNPPKEKSNEE